ncbi:MAG: ATP synthase F0 subunit B [Bacilli bacterium]|nr:ATP synthase F0 subunit B [Bacilli bacterium]
MPFLADAPIDPESILPKISINLWSFLTQMIAFLILVIAVFFLAYKPVKKFLKKRNEYVKSNIDMSRKNELASEEKLKAADDRVNSSYKEAKEIISAAKIDAEKERALIISKAKDEAKFEKIKASEEIEAEIKKSQDEIHKEMVDIALLASEKILEREVTTADNKKRVDNFIKDIQSN